MTGPDGTADGIHTWSCTGCSTWAERYWPTPEQARQDPEADRHQHECPTGRIVIVSRRPDAAHRENLGLERRMGAYDPDELLLVPYWAVLAARGLAEVMSRQTDRAHRIDLGDPVWVGFLSETVLAAHPVPGQTPSADPRDLVELLRRLADAFKDALPKP
jgi:hypothetical protein